VCSEPKPAGSGPEGVCDSRRITSAITSAEGEGRRPHERSFAWWWVAGSRRVSRHRPCGQLGTAASLMSCRLCRGFVVHPTIP